MQKRNQRFNLDNLQCIRYSRGDGETTIAEYTYNSGGKTVTKYAPVEDLTKAERDAALTFILLYGDKTTAATRRKKPRGRAVASRTPGNNPRPKATPIIDAAELEDITLEQIAPEN